MEFSTELFMKETIERWMGHLLNLLRHVAAEPEVTLSKADILDEEEKQKLLIEFNNTQTEFMKNTNCFTSCLKRKQKKGLIRPLLLKEHNRSAICDLMSGQIGLREHYTKMDSVREKERLYWQTVRLKRSSVFLPS